MVGRLFGPEKQMARDYLTDVSELPANEQTALCEAWDSAPEQVASLGSLHVAALNAFLEHAAALEDLSASDATERSRWRHLPYWLASNWLPVPGDVTRVVKDALGGPVFFGSAFGLRDNLAEIAARSPLRLGTCPSYLELKQSDPRAYYDMLLDGLDEELELHTIWSVFHQAANLSIERNVPMWMG